MESATESQGLMNLGGKYLTFALSNERYGLAILKVQEIIGVPSITKVPKCPDYIKGVINLRGKIIPLIDLRIKFGLKPVPYDEKTCIVVANIRREEQTISIGVIVDTVLEVINFSHTEIQRPPNYGASVHTRSIIGMGRKEGAALNILIDIESALSTADLNSLSQAID